MKIQYKCVFCFFILILKHQFEKGGKRTAIQFKGAN